MQKGKPNTATNSKPNRGGKPARNSYGPQGHDRKNDRRPAPPRDRAARDDRGEREEAAPAREDIISGRNAVTEALKSEQPVNKVWLAENNDPQFAGAIFRLCKQRGIPCHQLPKTKLERIAGRDHHGVAAEIAALPYAELEDILARAAERGEAPFVMVLDGVEDPHNLGAIIRSALSAGAHGVVISKRRAAALNQTVMKTSAGAAAYLPVARVANLNQALDTLKEAGCWAVAADMDGERLWQLPLADRAVALVMGSEGEGISPLLKKNCDFVASIPMLGEVGSLNVSAAAAVLMYEVVRQRRGQ